MTKAQCIPLKSCLSSEAYSYSEPSEENVHTVPLPAWICLLCMLCDPFIAVNGPCSHSRSTLSLVHLSLLTCSRTLLLQLFTLLDYISSLLDHSCYYHQTFCDIVHCKISSLLDTVFLSGYSISFFCSKTPCKQLLTPAASPSVSSLLQSSTFT